MVAFFVLNSHINDFLNIVWLIEQRRSWLSCSRKSWTIRKYQIFWKKKITSLTTPKFPSSYINQAQPYITKLYSPKFRKIFKFHMPLLRLFDSQHSLGTVWDAQNTSQVTGVAIQIRFRRQDPCMKKLTKQGLSTHTRSESREMIHIFSLEFPFHNDVHKLMGVSQSLK